MKGEQVLTRFLDLEFENSAEDQKVKANIRSLSNASLPLVVVQQPTLGSTRLVGASKPPCSKKKRGGWPQSRSLEWADVKDIGDAVHHLARSGYAPNYFVTIMPHAEDPSRHKRVCQGAIAHLGQSLKRRGHLHVGLTIFEHPRHEDLHAHHLLYVPRGEMERLAKWNCAAADIRVRRVRTLNELILYLLKERRWLSPDFEAWLRSTNGPFRRPCRPVPGKRWSITTSAKELLNSCDPMT